METKRFEMRATDLERLGLVLCFIHTDDEQRRAQALANARLIAAAPELLEALEGLLRDKKEPMDAATSDWFWKQAENAIARAEIKDGY